MKVKLIRKNDVITSKWAGGESRQYFIYPVNSSYAARNFSFRLSMAESYSEEEAKYSNLENYTRHLIMLEGSTHVFHKDHYDIVMEPYKDIDVFDGGWESSASGKVTDFNMMLSKGCHGKMTVVENDGMVVNEFCVECDRLFDFNTFYCGSGEASLEMSTGEKIEISGGDLAILENVEVGVEINVNLKNSKLVRMDICCSHIK
nr:HutD family protein [Sedimentibacter sp.]